MLGLCETTSVTDGAATDARLCFTQSVSFDQGGKYKHQTDNKPFDPEPCRVGTGWSRLQCNDSSSCEAKNETEPRNASSHMAGQENRQCRDGA